MITQDYLPNFLEAEEEARQAQMDRDTMIRYRQTLAARWFNYYKSVKNQRRKQEILNQYNKIATMCSRERD